MNHIHFTAPLDGLLLFGIVSSSISHSVRSEDIFDSNDSNDVELIDKPMFSFCKISRIFLMIFMQLYGKMICVIIEMIFLNSKTFTYSYNTILR